MDQLDSVTENELDLIVKINHEKIVRYFDHFHKSIGSKHKTFLITEFCEVSRYKTYNHLSSFRFS
jgi:hypothetical protein